MKRGRNTVSAGLISLILGAALVVGLQGTSLASGGDVVEAADDPTGAVSNAVTNTAQTATNDATNTAQTATTAANTAQTATNDATNTAQAATNTAQTAANSAAETANNAANSAAETANNAANNATQTVNNAATNATQTVNNAATNATQTVNNAATNATQTVNNAATNATQAATNADLQSGVAAVGSGAGLPPSETQSNGSSAGSIPPVDQAQQSGLNVSTSGAASVGGGDSSFESQPAKDRPDHLAMGDPESSDFPVLVTGIEAVSEPQSAAAAAQETGDSQPGWFFGLLPYTGIALLIAVVAGLALIAQGSAIVGSGESRAKSSLLRPTYEPTATR